MPDEVELPRGTKRAVVVRCGVIAQHLEDSNPKSYKSKWPKLQIFSKIYLRKPRIIVQRIRD